MPQMVFSVANMSPEFFFCLLSAFSGEYALRRLLCFVAACLSVFRGCVSVCASFFLIAVCLCIVSAVVFVCCCLCIVSSSLLLSLYRQSSPYVSHLCVCVCVCLCVVVCVCCAFVWLSVRARARSRVYLCCVPRVFFPSVLRAKTLYTPHVVTDGSREGGGVAVN